MSKQRKNEVLHAALEVFGEPGSQQDSVKRADLSKAGLYWYFNRRPISSTAEFNSTQVVVSRPG